MDLLLIRLVVSRIAAGASVEDRTISMGVISEQRILVRLAELPFVA